MPNSPLITAQALHDLVQRDPASVLICDCRYDLVDSGLGHRLYLESHIPQAIYVSVDEHLSSKKTGTNGRHPLPTLEVFAERLSRLGVREDTLIVGYDNNGGLYASRLWWMARWAGHSNVVVLDGGLPAWQAAGYPTTTVVPPERPPTVFKLRETLTSQVDFENMLHGLKHPDRLIIDARPADRFQGQNETLDPRAGHIPGAINRTVKENLNENGTFKDRASLQAEFSQLLGKRSARHVVASCGSGVSACHLLLSMHIAGMPGGALYGGSWSEWSAHPDAPLETGPGRGLSEVS